jgi:arginase family enzyme
MSEETPLVYGATPTLFRRRYVRPGEEIGDADVAFLGIPWRAPNPAGRSSLNYEGSLLTPTYFRTNSTSFGGFLPELEVDVFDHFKMVDLGDADVVGDMATSLANVEKRVAEAIGAGCMMVTIGGNSGVSTYPVLKAIAGAASGPTAVLNLDAHHDNFRGEWEEDDPRNPRWASSWARRILGLPGVDPARYFHFGLRGAVNDKETFLRFTERGVLREHILTYRELKLARREGFDGWAQALAERVTDGTAKVWICVDPDVLNVGSNPDFGDEPLGPTNEEVIELFYQVGRLAGRDRFGGISFGAVPFNATSLHYVCYYFILYALAGVATANAAPSRLQGA